MTTVTNKSTNGDASSLSSPPPRGGETWRGWKAAFGTNPRALACYRISLGVLLLIELGTRFNYLHAFYSDEGTLPMRLLRPKIDPLYSILCLHCQSGSLLYIQLLLSFQCLLAFSLTIGYHTRFAAGLSWYLYLSLTLRNTWLNFILDRYFHYLLFYASVLPALGDCWSVDSWLGQQQQRKSQQRTQSKLNGTKNGKNEEPSPMASGTSRRSVAATTSMIIVDLTTITFKLQLLWIYLDAGYGKYTDPNHGWSYNAQPLPALDTYVRHTVMARYAYALLQPAGLRLLTPTVVYAELGVAPLMLLGSWFGSKRVVWGAMGIAWGLHLGIMLTVRNTVLLSSVAMVTWFICLPPPPTPPLLSTPPSPTSLSSNGTNNGEATGETYSALLESRRQSTKVEGLVRSVLTLSLLAACLWFELYSTQCTQSVTHIWSTLLHNRWNVFVGAEDYVTWEIAPGRLADGTVVDVWSGSEEGVDWSMPVSGTPCTSTTRAGRWRSFPYLAELDGDEGEVLWGYLCRQWDGDHDVATLRPDKKLLRYNFFMLQADVLPAMGFSSTRKRLVHSHDCTIRTNFATVPSSSEEEESEDEEKNTDNVPPPGHAIDRSEGEEL